MINSIFINIPVTSVERSKAFFSKLGFHFNTQFTNDVSACLIIAENINVMLSEHARFAQLMDKKVADSNTSEVVLSLGCDSAERVREIAEGAFALGARKLNEPEDHGFMFSWAFEDLDGHLWDLFWMDPSHSV